MSESNPKKYALITFKKTEVKYPQHYDKLPKSITRLLRDLLKHKSEMRIGTFGRYIEEHILELLEERIEFIGSGVTIEYKPDREEIRVIVYDEEKAREDTGLPSQKKKSEVLGPFDDISDSAKRFAEYLKSEREERERKQVTKLLKALSELYEMISEILK